MALYDAIAFQSTRHSMLQNITVLGSCNTAWIVPGGAPPWDYPTRNFCGQFQRYIWLGYHWYHPLISSIDIIHTYIWDIPKILSGKLTVGPWFYHPFLLVSLIFQPRFNWQGRTVNLLEGILPMGSHPIHPGGIQSTAGGPSLRTGGRSGEFTQMAGWLCYMSSLKKYTCTTVLTINHTIIYIYIHVIYDGAIHWIGSSM